MLFSSFCWSLHPLSSRIIISLHLVSTETLIRTTSLKQSQLLHQKILDPFHPNKVGFIKIRFTKFNQENRVSRPTSFDMLFGAQSWFSIGHIFYLIELKFFGVYCCVFLAEKKYQKSTSKEKNLDKKRKEKNSKKEKIREKEHIRNTSIALLFMVPFLPCPYFRCYLLYLFHSLVCHNWC
jgi:hypothetical protein